MKGQRSDSDTGLSRRSVLRQGTAVAVGSTVGITMLSSTVAATRVCPRSPGYWSNHDWRAEWLANVNEVLAPTGVSFGSVTEGQQYLKDPPRGDKGDMMAFHLIATVLNFQEYESDCYDLETDVADVTDTTAPDQNVTDVSGEETMIEIKRLAQNWLYESNFPDPQSSWMVESAAVPDGEVLKDLLDEYNNNDLLECTCETEEEEDSGGPPEDRGNSGGGPP